MVDIEVAIRLRGFLVIFDLAQIINLVWLSFKTQCVALPALIGIGVDFALVSLDELLVISETGPSHPTSNMLFISEFLWFF
jgi:hypothetical protein